MSIGFHFNDVEEELDECYVDFSDMGCAPIGAPFHDEEEQEPECDGVPHFRD